jgi:type VI secretion system protein VasG
MVEALITNSLLPEIGREFLTRLMQGAAIKRVHVGVKEDAFVFAFD